MQCGLPARGAVLVLMLAACGGDSSGPIAVASVEVSSPGQTLVVGDNEQFTATTLDARGASLSGRAIVWTSRDPAVATVTQSGVATAVSPGTATIEATSGGKRGERTLTVVAPASPVSASGQLFMIDGLAPGPLTAALRIGNTPPRSVSVGPDGRFGLTSVAPGDPVDVLINAPSGAWVPSLVRLSRAAVSASELRIVLVPRRWTIASGTYASSTIDISPNQAFTPPCTTAGDINCDGFYPKSWVTGIKLWDDATLPAPVAFDHARTAAPISASDSVAFWAIVRQMEADIGRTLFRPATASQLAVEADGWSAGAVMVRIDASLVPGRGYTNWRWDSRGVVFTAVTRVGSAAALGTSSLVTHELLHAIGLKHSCAWPTVMGGYGCASAAGLTRQDVGYARLAIELARIQRAASAYRNLYDAMQGERVALL
ncbi:MAG TPA: Ig-like domain-containing protein, partial [Gemmatimonadaceae bacterium]|nr:Ig-like domain-containing protein [Gemmatimonadaceae bacterium]